MLNKFKIKKRETKKLKTQQCCQRKCLELKEINKTRLKREQKSIHFKNVFFLMFYNLHIKKLINYTINLMSIGQIYKIYRIWEKPKEGSK